MSLLEYDNPFTLAPMNKNTITLFLLLRLLTDRHMHQVFHGRGQPSLVLLGGEGLDAHTSSHPRFLGRLLALHLVVVRGGIYRRRRYLPTPVVQLMSLAFSFVPGLKSGVMNNKLIIHVPTVLLSCNRISIFQ